jgi:NADH-quinone oxidoreductase subunit J
LLLVAIIAAIALTLRQRKDSKAINPVSRSRCAQATVCVVVPMRRHPPAGAPTPTAGRGGQGMSSA